jgi:hypothetical protein
MILKYFQEEPSSEQRTIFDLVYSFLTHNTQKKKEGKQNENHHQPSLP